MKRKKLTDARIALASAPVTIKGTTDALTGVHFSIGGGKFLLRRNRMGSIEVIDNDGNVIGTASDYLYGGAGFAVHTAAYGGYVPVDQCVWVK